MVTEPAGCLSQLSSEQHSHVNVCYFVLFWSCYLGTGLVSWDGTHTDSGLLSQNSRNSSKLAVSAPVFMDYCPEPIIIVSPCVSNLP